MTSPSWDPAQYLRYEAERARPWQDLVNRLADLTPSTVVDLGCGPGHLTATLGDRWPGASVTGIDSSAAMIEAAMPLARPGNLEFRLGEIERWWPDRPVDVIISNAALQWVPTHLGLMRRWITDALAPCGALAVQMPADSDATNTIREVAISPRWAGRLGTVAHGAGPRGRSPVREPIVYAETLASLSAEVDVWETTYLHVLTGDDPVLEWFAGTGLRPYLDAFGDNDAARADFRADVAAALRETFPRGDYGTILPFRRIFAVARIATRAD